MVQAAEEARGARSTDAYRRGEALQREGADLERSGKYAVATQRFLEAERFKYIGVLLEWQEKKLLRCAGLSRLRAGLAKQSAFGARSHAADVRSREVASSASCEVCQSKYRKSENG